MSSDNEARIDKYLWSVRIYKTRSQAADACKNSRILINNICVKPSRIVNIGENLTVKKMPVVYSYRIIAVPSSRLSAKLVPDYIENLTTEEELVKLDIKPGAITGFRKRGLGRPTKRERRDIDRLKDSDL